MMASGKARPTSLFRHRRQGNRSWKRPVNLACCNCNDPRSRVKNDLWSRPTISCAIDDEVQMVAGGSGQGNPNFLWSSTHDVDLE